MATFGSFNPYHYTTQSSSFQPSSELCKRCGRPLTDPERQADGMGWCCRRQEPHRRRLRYLGHDTSGADLFRIHSLTSAGDQLVYYVQINQEDGTFRCTCPAYTYSSGDACKHIKRAQDYLQRRNSRRPVEYEHSCPQCMGYFDGPGDCPTCGGVGIVREVG